jgi:hypothetical protein
VVVGIGVFAPAGRRDTALLRLVQCAGLCAMVGFLQPAATQAIEGTSETCASEEPAFSGKFSYALEHGDAALDFSPESPGSLNELVAMTPSPLSMEASALVPYPVRLDPTPSYGRMFFRTWAPVTMAEFALLGITATLPKSWTGWSAHFVRDGINHLGEAYSRPPDWDDDWWVHNYVGHPYGGSLYYNSVRGQGATPLQSMLFATVLSTQWEYLFEAFAERPSIQDLVVTPVAGAILGELSHRLTLQLERGGTTTGEKILIVVTNPGHAIFSGF